jgi:hypothetical protein
MSTEHTATPQPPAPLADDEWTQDHEELPPRPRRRLLGTGGNPVQIALLGVLLLACGFIGGVLVEKGQTSSTTGGAAAGLASKLAALRGTGASGSSGSSGGAGGAGGGFARRFAGGAPGDATIGEVAYISGSTLYVSGTEGNTVKVTTSPASSITKTVKSDVHGIHPGETVIVRGTKSASGAVSAESISVGAGAGASASGSTRAGGGGGGASGGSGEPALFGK